MTGWSLPRGPRTGSALGKAVEAGSSNQVLRQQLVCDHLDVVASESLDWHAIDSVLSNARKVQDLQQLDELVPLSACVNWQKVAAAVALTRRFAVISGGPGTGKTTTVTKLLAALIEQAKHEKNLTIKLVAPTGKAAARLTESIGKAVQELPVSPELKLNKDNQINRTKDYSAKIAATSSLLNL